jgi:hypothetical protein
MSHAMSRDRRVEEKPKGKTTEWILPHVVIQLIWMGALSGDIRDLVRRIEGAREPLCPAMANDDVHEMSVRLLDWPGEKIELFDRSVRLMTVAAACNATKCVGSLMLRGYDPGSDPVRLVEGVQCVECIQWQCPSVLHRHQFAPLCRLRPASPPPKFGA